MVVVPVFRRYETCDEARCFAGWYADLMVQDDDEAEALGIPWETVRAEFAFDDVGRRASRGSSRDELLAEYPNLRDEDIEQARRFIGGRGAVAATARSSTALRPRVAPYRGKSSARYCAPERTSVRRPPARIITPVARAPERTSCSKTNVGPAPRAPGPAPPAPKRTSVRRPPPPPPTSVRRPPLRA
jgi:hypothetical protein